MNIAASKNGFKNLKNEIPELKIAITSVLFASFEVNQITDRKRKIGNKRFAKYTESIYDKSRINSKMDSRRFFIKETQNG